MALIDIKNLKFSYDGNYKTVFDGIDLRIDTDWKLGLVGRNGRGKTTLLKLLCGEYEYGGSIVCGVKLAYFPYSPEDGNATGAEIFTEVCPQAPKWQIVRELSLLGMDDGVLYRAFDTLSGGEQTKLLLAALFLNDGDFPLIDEPTNHLDTQARKTVADYLAKKRGFILVSHDRAFLDGCVDHIMSINKTDIEIVAGNFSSWQENFERRQSFEQTQNDKLKKDIARLEQAARRTAEWADKTEKGKFGVQASGLKADRGYVGHKSAKMMKRAKSAEARRDRAISEKSAMLKNVETSAPLKLFVLNHRGGRLLAFSDVEVFYDGQKACGPISFEMNSGDRIALRGKNGCGKSSLLKLAIGRNIEHSGEIVASSGLKISYVPQNIWGLRGSLTDFARDSGIDESLFKTILRKLDFSRNDFDADMSEYSAGQKKKALIAKSLCESAHLYVWDEPLNYIEVYSRIQIERLLNEYRPSMLFVEHDEAFCAAVATEILNI